MELFEDKININIFNVISKNWLEISRIHEGETHLCLNPPGKIYGFFFMGVNY